MGKKFKITEDQLKRLVENKDKFQEEPVETTEEEMTQMEQPSGLLDDDPVISDINSTMTNSEDEDINKTSDDLEGFDFENIDLELQENPGL